jgi:hypothetical protein
MAIVPARNRESRAQCSYVVMQLQKSAGSILASNKLARSAPKRVTVRVNGGLGAAVTDTQVSAATALEEMTGDSACAGESVQYRARPKTA